MASRNGKNGGNGKTAEENIVIRALFNAAEEGDCDKILDLINQTGCLDCKDKNGDTLLITAARKDQEEAVELLLREGADPWITNEEDWNAMDIAAKHEHYNVVKLLRSAMNETVWIHPELQHQPPAGVPI